jgi:hypothetical protein
MRDTFIGVFGGIVLIVSVLCFALVRLAFGDVATKGEARTAVNAAAAQLELETVQVERWLANQALDEEANDAFETPTPEVRGDLATKFADLVTERAAKASSAEVPEIKPTGVFVFDDKGVVLGRDHSKLSRGDQLGEIYPDLLKAITAGKTGSALWISKALNHQMLASYAPIRNSAGKVVGGIAFGRALLERLNAASSLSNNAPLFALVPAGDDMAIFARTGNATTPMEAGVPSAKTAIGSDQTVALGGLSDRFDGAARALISYGNGRQAVVAAIVEKKRAGSLQSMLPALGLALVIGFVLVAIASHLVDKFVSQPVADLEEGLLAVLNGQTDLRFELEHPLYGGLVFRLNSLLNQLTGVQEDNTDEQGRSSAVPTSQSTAATVSFTAPLNLDEKHVESAPSEVEGAIALGKVAPEDYYKELYDTFRESRSAVGAPVDVKFAAFSQRIKHIEAQLSKKHDGRTFRLRIEVDGKDVVFVAVPVPAI